MLPYMIKSSSFGVDRNSCYVKVYSMCKVARQFGYMIRWFHEHLLRHWMKISLLVLLGFLLMISMENMMRLDVVLFRHLIE